MKPTSKLSFQARSSRGDIRGSPGHAFPLIDYNFQSSMEARSVAALPGKTSRVSSFRQLSTEFLGQETSRDFVKEAILFTVIVAISAWPIMQMIGALAWLVR